MLPTKNMNMELSVTLPETYIAPENGWLEDEISFRDGLFGQRLLLVSGSVN